MSLTKAVPYGRQHIKSVDINAVREVLTADFITQGPKVDEFERALADYCGAKYAVAVSSGTAALHLASLAAGLKKGDEAITTPITFLATSNAILYAGATPVFADIDYETINLDPSSIKRKITSKTKAVFPVDFAGLPAAMAEIATMAKRHRLMVIEDASHALGAEYRHGRVGSCKFSDMTIFSFHPVKHITTGEGGAITTNRRNLYEKLKALRSHGVRRSEKGREKIGGWYYEMQDLGFNYRITDFQCALGLAQLKRIDGFLQKRRKIVAKYDAAFSKLKNLKVPAQRREGQKHAYHLYLLRLQVKKTTQARKALYDTLKQSGILTQVHYIPVYQQPFYRRLFNGNLPHCPNAERYYDEVLSLPLFPDLKSTEQNRTIQVVEDFLSKWKLQ
ncbi:MAG: UDP-4-amino-4,6-dideoxy-N-acetyl-beta-L-altrosamine transaminase [Candidatus Omnitrophica bacterium]|nr:UDP-4-amino-4,6-dideoxy-N-acetyl-beta-L-altrosamine transaminase [Candidatus Omnitrophota bacterium]